MRDIIVTLIFLVGCFLTLKRPYYGILLWSWIGYMNPHRLTYGFAYDMPFAQMTAIVLVFSMLINKGGKSFPINKLTIIWIIFIMYMGITTIFARFPDSAITQFEKIIKIQVVIFLTMVLIDNIMSVRKLIWVIVLSIGYYSTKGGLFTLLHAGQFKVWGPASSFIEDNNSFAAATLMTIPLMIYLYQTSNGKWLKFGIGNMIVLSLFTIIGSQSRGAFLAICTIGLFFWVKSKHKFATGIVIVVCATTLLIFAPETWYKRMDTIENYNEDASAMGRLNAWEYAFNAANDNLLGMGFDSWKPLTFAVYAPNPNDVHAAHSIYFSVLADHGWIGLVMFLIIFYSSYSLLKSLIKKTNNKESLFEINILSKMMQISFIAYLTAGTFLSLSYFDLPWHLISIIMILSQIVDNENLASKIM